MPSKRQIVRGSMVVGVLSLLGGLTGILVETSIAARLGLSRGSDTFYVAFTVPYIITNLVGATGQFSLVPFFSSLDARHAEDDLWNGLSYALNVVFLGTTAIAILGAAGAPWLIRGIAPGFVRPETLSAVELCRWLFIIIVPASVAEVFRSFLLSRRRFALPSGAGFFRNVTVIAFVVLAFHRYGPFSIVYGYMAGYALQIALLGGETWWLFPFRYSLTVDARGEAFRNLHGAGASQIAAALAWQGVVIVERMIASFLPPGTLTALNYGFKIMSTISELLAGSLGTAALPGLSRAVARQSANEERLTFQHLLEIGLVLVAPMTVFCLLLSRPIIRLVFERGNFTPQATTLMSEVFFYYSLSLVLYSVVRILNFYLFARHQGVIFLRLSLAQYVLTILGDLFFVAVLGLGAKGIPLGLLTGLVVICAITVRRNIAGVRSVLDRALAIFTAKSLLGAALAAIAIALLRGRILSPATGLANVAYLVELCGVGSVIFLATLAASRAVRLTDFSAIWQHPEDA